MAHVSLQLLSKDRLTPPVRNSFSPLALRFENFIPIYFIQLLRPFYCGGTSSFLLSAFYRLSINISYLRFQFSVISKKFRLQHPYRSTLLKNLSQIQTDLDVAASANIILSLHSRQRFSNELNNGTTKSSTKLGTGAVTPSMGLRGS